MSTALIFPGQGAPAPDWHQATLDLKPELIELATELCGADPFTRFGESTEFDQLAVYCASIAAYESLGRPDADFCAGHSLGEIAALVAAGEFDESDGLRVVAARGRAMASAGKGLDRGCMLAVRSDWQPLEAVAARHEVAIANLNTPRQTVLSGLLPALELAAAELAEAGLRSKMLPVADAFHSPRMLAAADELADAIDAAELGSRRIRVISALTGSEMLNPKAALVVALTGPVRWVDVVRNLESAGVDRWVEVGPGKALGRMVSQIIEGEAEIGTSRIPEAANA